MEPVEPMTRMRFTSMIVAGMAAVTPLARPVGEVQPRVFVPLFEEIHDPQALP